MKIAWIEAAKLAAGGIPLGLGDLEDLHQQGIRAIVTLTEPPITNQREITPEVLSQLDIEAFHFPIVDQYPPEAERVADGVRFVDQMMAQGRPVYVHCHAGVGRTGTFLHAYYLKKGSSLDEAKAKVKAGKFTSQFLMLSDTQRAFLEQFAIVKKEER
jgi:atypical dual specificity phosphatase